MQRRFKMGSLRRNLGILAFCLPASTLQATPVAVPNYSFETPSGATFAGVSTAIDNWTTYGDAPFDTGGGPNSSGTGIFPNQNPDASINFSNANQSQVAYIFSKSGIATNRDGLEQILATTFSSGKSYDLTVALGLANSAPGSTEPFTFALFYYDPANPTARNVVATRTVFNNGATPLSKTLLNDVTVSSPILTSGNVAIGKQIGIEMFTALGSDTTAAAGRQYDFDNVRLNEVPEPASIGLLAAALAAPLCIRRRRF